MFLPRFSGDDNPESWIFRAELYFTYLGFSKKDWLPLPSFYLEGDALAWFNWLFRNNQFYDWNHFKEKFLLHFQKRAFSDAARMANTSRSCVNYLSCATVVPPATYVSPAHSRIANFYESASTQIPKIPEPIARVVDGDKYAIVVDKVFDENPHSHETAMHSQVSNDEALLVLPVGGDYFVPKSVEQFEILSINSTEHLDAMKIKSDSDDESLEEDQQGYTKVEDNSRNMADQVFATNPQRNAGEQLIQFAPLNMDHLASLVPGDKFSFGHILVVLVRVHLNNGHMRDTYYYCHTRACACAYLYCAYESTREIIMFWSCMDNWFDTGQGFKDNSCVLLYGEPKDLYRNQEFSKTKVITSNLENLEDGQFEGSFLSLGFHCKPTLKEDVKNMLWFHHDCKIYLDCWCDTRQECNLPGFLLCKLRVQAREEKIQVMLQAFAKIYSKHSPHIRVSKDARLLFALFGLVHKARSTSTYIVFDPGPCLAYAKLPMLAVPIIAHKYSNCICSSNNARDTGLPTCSYVDKWFDTGKVFKVSLGRVDMHVEHNGNFIKSCALCKLLGESIANLFICSFDDATGQIEEQYIVDLLRSFSSGRALQLGALLHALTFTMLFDTENAHEDALLKMVGILAATSVHYTALVRVVSAIPLAATYGERATIFCELEKSIPNNNLDQVSRIWVMEFREALVAGVDTEQYVLKYHVGGSFTVMRDNFGDNVGRGTKITVIKSMVEHQEDFVDIFANSNAYMVAHLHVQKGTSCIFLQKYLDLGATTVKATSPISELEFTVYFTRDYFATILAMKCHIFYNDIDLVKTNWSKQFYCQYASVLDTYPLVWYELDKNFSAFGNYVDKLNLLDGVHIIDLNLEDKVLF
ncbi:hypothetical protein A4A49_00152 [Nicotiana attenuata]|uniref:Uncharacterized protein n=1 Tax=Nicotiana attenuata TaxID=49451 RepID=A0A1J6J3Q0_NICAT|nr:hypothetical protein A4A49_00152 [Nicotiana attenuata]